MKTNAGVLLPIFSLPGHHGIGDFGESCFTFIDWLSKHHYRYWQILPLNPIGDATSPYTSACSEAIDERFISLDFLKEEGLINDVPLYRENATFVKYESVKKFKTKYLKEAYENYRKTNMDGLRKFKTKNPWVIYFSTYMSFKEKNNGKPWYEWDKKEIRYFDKHNNPPKSLIDKADYYAFVQYIAYYQWKKVLSYARRKNIKIIADLPFYVGYDSTDCWIYKDQFLLDEKYSPKFVGGVPPDYFNENGQKWGNPIYNFEKMEKDGFSFLINRIGYISCNCDILRLDHFRAWDTYCLIPNQDEDGRNGVWKLGPGSKFLDKLYEKYPKIQLIAEDLGELRNEVYELRDKYNLPGMFVSQFTMLDWERFPNENQIVYSGTHDNQTLYGWFKSLNQTQLDIINNRLIYPKNLYQALFDYIWNAPSKFTIFPLQDLLKLDDKARMNWPGTSGEPNFCFKFKDFSWINKIKFGFKNK